MSDRAELLKRLVEFRGPIETILEELRLLGWDWDGEPLLVLSADHYQAVLSRFLGGEIDARQLEDWAGNLESRDDIGFDPEQAELLKTLLFRIATPEINQPLTAGLVKDIQNELSANRS